MKFSISAKLDHLKSSNKKALVSFIVADCPTHDASFTYAKSLIEAGTDILEIGMPFSDPAADGVAIQAASQIALANGVTRATILELASKINSSYPEVPIVLMGYYNNIYNVGEKQFVQDAAEAGVSGLIIVDLPFEMASSMRTITRKAGLALIPLIAPNTPKERMAKILADAEGFIYAISVKGTTGSKIPEMNRVKTQVELINSVSDLPIMLGFGIKEPAQAQMLSKVVDGIVVGSAYCNIINDNQSNTTAAAQAIFIKAQAIKKSIN